MKPATTFLLFLLVFSFACKKDEDKTPVCDGSNPTYDDGIRSIINNNCTDSGCHDSGSSDGNFTTYSGLLEVLDNGKFERAVLTDQTMPEGGELTQAQLNKIKCWVDNDYPEN